MERLAYLRPNTPFRSNFTYSNLNYAAITYVVELVTKRTYYDLLAEYIFKPLEMQASSNYTALVESGAQVSEGWIRQGVNYTQCLEDLSEADPTAMVLPPACAGTPEAIEFWTQGSGQEWGGGGNVIATGNDLVSLLITESS
jgi:CubicO group peptidase (beta-lactamase class C family)